MLHSIGQEHNLFVVVIISLYECQQKTLRNPKIFKCHPIFMTQMSVEFKRLPQLIKQDLVDLPLSKSIYTRKVIDLEFINLVLTEIQK